MSYKKKYCLSDRSKRRRVQEGAIFNLVIEPSFPKNNNLLVTSNEASTSLTAINSVLTNTIIANEKESYKELIHSSSSSISSFDEDIGDNET
jgi:hypothetical protein